MGYEINWTADAGDPITKSPFYQKYSRSNIGSLILPEVQTDLANALASRESAAVINYLSWLVRCIQLTL